MSSPPIRLEEGVRTHIENAPLVDAKPRVGEWPQGAYLGLDDIQQLPEFYSAVNAVLRERRSTLRLPEETANHELQHMEAFQAIGATSGEPHTVGAGLCVVRHPLRSQWRLGRLSLVPVTYTAPLLKPFPKAAVLGYPEKPSERDVEHVRALGYGSIAALRRAIEQHNDRYPDTPLPMPLSR